MHSQMRGLFTLSQRPSRRGLAPPAGDILAPSSARRLSDFHGNMARRNPYEVQVAAERSKRGLSVWRDEGAAHKFAMVIERPASAAGGLWVLVFVCGCSVAVSRVLCLSSAVCLFYFDCCVSQSDSRGVGRVSSGHVRFDVGNACWCPSCPRAITVCVCVWWRCTKISLCSLCVVVKAV